MKSSTMALCILAVVAISLGAALGLILYYTLPREEDLFPGYNETTVATTDVLEY